MKIFWIDIFDAIALRIEPLRNSLKLKVIQLGDLYRVPTNPDLDKFLNAILIKPIEGTFEWLDAQKRKQKQLTSWELFYIKRWVGSSEGYTDLIKEGENIKIELEKDETINYLRNIRFASTDTEGKIWEFNITGIKTDTDADIFFKTGLADITAILIKFDIEILTQRKGG